MIDDLQFDEGPAPEVPFEEPEQNGNGHAPADLERLVLPSAVEAERRLISYCLLDAEAMGICRGALLRADQFYDPQARMLWGRLSSMADQKMPLEASLLAEQLVEHQQVGTHGEAAKLVMRFSDSAGTTALLRHDLQRVIECAVRRDVIAASARATESLYDLSVPLEEPLEGLRQAVRPVVGVAGAYTVWQPEAFRLWVAPPNINLMGGGYLRRRQLTTLIGPPGVGKSRLSLWMAVSHICGRTFFDLDMQNGPARWLFFGNENDPLRQKTDLELFYRHLLAEEKTEVDANLFLHVIDRPDDGIITLADPDAYAKLNATLKAVQPEVVVFDPWGNMIEGNENDNEEVRRTLKALLRAISANCPDAAILVIHHARTGKATAIEAGNNYSGGSLGRGSKALVSSARCELALWPGHSEDSSRLVLTCEKVNNVQKFDPKGIIYDGTGYRDDPEFTVSGWRDDIEGVRGTKTLTIRDVVDIVRAGRIKAGEIAAAAEQEFGVVRSTAMLRLKDAVDRGYLSKTMPTGSYTLGSTPLPPART